MAWPTRLAAALVFAGALAAQNPAPALVRGELLDCDVSPGGGGEFSVRTETHQVFRFTFDRKTYFEREKQRTSATGLEKGDLIEVVADRASEPVVRYARTVHVVDRPRRPPVSQGRYRSYRTSLDHIIPMGNLTFAGVVARLEVGRLVLRTRKDGEKTIVLRDDTRYLEGGVQVAADELKANTRVFVRGAKNFEDDIEAYQVVWGEILDPAARR
jgi:hypothetical protein